MWRELSRENTEKKPDRKKKIGQKKTLRLSVTEDRLYDTLGLCERLLGIRPVRSGKEHLERDHRA